MPVRVGTTYSIPKSSEARCVSSKSLSAGVTDNWGTTKQKTVPESCQTRHDVLGGYGRGKQGGYELIYRVDEPSTQLSDDGDEAGTDQTPGARKAVARQQDVG
jgi:hypothetical protein